MGVNYGCGRVRFPSPVPVGSHLRLGVTLTAAEDVPGGVQITQEFVFEVEGASKPSCVAEVEPPPGAGSRLPRRALRAAALGERPGPPRRLPAQRQRVPRGDARRVQGPRRAVQRQLPLRRRGARLPAERRRRPTAIVYHARSRRRWPRCCRSCPAARRSCRSPTTSANALLPGAPSTTRRRSPRASRSAAGRSAVARRPLHPLHRRHDGHAEGRAVAPGRHLRRALRRLGRPPRTLDEFVAARPAADVARLLVAAVHARRRPLDRASARWHQRRHGRRPGRCPSASTRTTSGARSSARRSTSCSIVGDAFARPLLDELEPRRRTTCRR